MTITQEQPVENPSFENPSFEECECSVRRDMADEWEAEEFHTALLGLNGPRPLRAVARLLTIITDLHPTVTDPIEIRRYVAQHNWVDPVAVSEIADCLRFFDYSRTDIDWLSRVARGEINPCPDMTNGVAKRILEGVQGKCSWAS